jgi:2-oxoglutarate ferredoxin oxidoreductase subunit alpha
MPSPIAPFPGNKHPLSSYFTRGTGHDEYAKYTEDSAMYMKNMERLARKQETAKNTSLHLFCIPPKARPSASSPTARLRMPSSKHSTSWKMNTASNLISCASALFRSPKEVDDFIASHDQVFIVEMNRDAQMRQIMLIEYPQYAMRLKAVAYHDGLPAAAQWVREGILSQYRSRRQKSKQ